MKSAKTDWKSNSSEWGWENNSDQDILFCWFDCSDWNRLWRKQSLRDRPWYKLIRQHCVDLLSKKHNSPISTNRHSYFTALLRTSLLPPKLFCGGFFWLYVNSPVKMHTFPNNSTCEWLQPLTLRVHFLLTVNPKRHFCSVLFLSSLVVIVHKPNKMLGSLIPRVKTLEVPTRDSNHHCNLHQNYVL